MLGYVTSLVVPHIQDEDDDEGRVQTCFLQSEVLQSRTTDQLLEAGGKSKHTAAKPCGVKRHSISEKLYKRPLPTKVMFAITGDGPTVAP